MIRHLHASRSLPREGKAQILSLLPGLGLAAGEIAGLGELGGNGALPFCEGLQVPKPAKLVEGGPVGGIRFGGGICHQLQRCNRCCMLSPVIIGVGEPLLRVAPRAIHLLELRFTLSDPAGHGADVKHVDFEQPLCFHLVTDDLPVRPGTAMELVETALKVCEARGGDFVIILAATQ